MLDQVRLVLVRPIRPGNVGAVCRAMKNMGLRDLVIVAPACDLTHEDAYGFAMRGKSILESARVVGSLSAALDGCVRTYATSGKGGMYRKQASLEVRAAAVEAVAFAERGPVAMLFGPEDHGLTQAEILDVDTVVEIPTADAYPVMNLAAAATVVCYELRQAELAHAPVAPSRYDEPPADDARKRILFAKLFDGLERVGFFRVQQNPDHLKYALRRVFGRAGLSRSEVDILIGMSQQLIWYAEQTEPPARWAEHDAERARAREERS